MMTIFKNYWKEFSVGTKTMFKEFFKKDTNKKQRANMWTFTRLVVPFVTIISSVIALITNSGILFIGTSIIAGLGALTDKFDGASAKKHKSFSEYGKVLDQVTDKCFAGIIGINLLFLNLNYIYILLGELIIALTNIYYKLTEKNININSTLTGKIKQTPLFLALALGFLSTLNPLLLLISNISILITVLFQAATTSSYIINNNKQLRELKEFENNLINQNVEKSNNEEIYKKVLKKSLEEKNNTPISINKRCEILKEFKKEIEQSEEISEQNFQKTYKKND